ncbi:hypothetical protein GFY24_14455 [Nocardia sp. SYP-A9097]|uniref:hypothetical protein n=1 Tax=Nocardia sp. SYP-A9097 TaxID=2663237 RepID=UPI00129A10EB|nr:hypothetical protein [Nocardia sp. SYP-A9097]MRH88630.1 hypothetical protein [Nocardia sp. SYP-A9097]
MIGELIFLFLGTGLGIVLNSAVAKHHRGKGSGRTVAEIRDRIQREHRGRHWRIA